MASIADEADMLLEAAVLKGVGIGSLATLKALESFELPAEVEQWRLDFIARIQEQRVSAPVETLSTLTVTLRERRILASAVMLTASVQDALGEDPHAVDRCLKLHARIVEGLPDDE